MAARRKYEVEAARHCQEKREPMILGKGHRSVEFYETTTIALVDESKESCTGARRTETCVSPRHVEASRDF